jgi:hypothetical protein
MGRRLYEPESARPTRTELMHPTRGREQEQHAIDDPVAPRAARGRLLVLLAGDEHGGQETVSAHGAKRRRRGHC